MSMESRIAQRWAGTEKSAARLLKRHIKILEKYLDSRNLDGWEQIDYDSLPPQVRRDLDRVKATETLWMDVNRWIEDYMNDKRYRRRASEKTAAKNKRVFFDLRGDWLILDFRGDSGLSSLAIEKLEREFRNFKKDVVSTEKRVGLPENKTARGTSGIESFNGQLGFHVQRWYQWDDVSDTLGEGFQSEDHLADALIDAGWRVTFK